MDHSGMRVRQFRVELVKKWLKMDMNDDEITDMCLKNFCCQVRTAHEYLRTAKNMVKT